MAFDAPVGSLRIVAEEEGRQFLAALFGGAVGAGIGPFAQGCLNEALDLAVGLGRAGPRALMADAEPSQSYGTRPISRLGLSEDNPLMLHSEALAGTAMGSAFAVCSSSGRG